MSGAYAPAPSDRKDHHPESIAPSLGWTLAETREVPVGLEGETSRKPMCGPSMPTPPSLLVYASAATALVFTPGCAKSSSDPEPAVTEDIEVAAIATAALGPGFVDPVAVGDVDGDGLDDLVVFASVGEPGSPRPARILFGRTERLDGAFSQEELVPLAVSPSNAAVGRVVGLGDLDGDGDDELGLADPGVLEVHLGGPSLFEAAPRIISCNPEGDLGYFDVANVGDVDGDGTADLALSESGKVWLLTGEELASEGPLNCRDGRLLVEEDDILGAHTLALIPGDLDGDGFDDVVASRHGGVVVRLGGDVDAGARIDVLVEGGQWIGSPGSVSTGEAQRALLVSDTGTRLVVGDASPLRQLDGASLDAELEDLSITTSCAYRILGDLDGDGADEVAGFDGSGCGTPGAVRVRYGGNADASPAGGLVLPSYDPEHVIAAGDLDGDGFDDVALVGDDGVSARLDLVYGAPRD